MADSNNSAGSNDLKKLRILVVHEVSYPEKVIYEIHEFPELLSKDGNDVEFIDFAEGFDGRPGANPREWIQAGRVYPEARIRIHSPWLSGIFSLDRLVALMTVVPVLWRLRKKRFDVILNFAVPTYGLQVLVFGLLSGTPVVHRALDVSHKIRKSPWNPLISLVERAVFSLSSVVSANNPAMADYVQGRGLFGKPKVVVNLPPSLTPSMTAVPYASDLAADLGLSKDNFVAAYLGYFFYFSGLDRVIEDFSEAAAANPEMRLLLVGGGEQELHLKGLCVKLGVSSKVIFTGFISFDDIPRYLSLADVAINPMEVSGVSNYALPNKVIQYLALNIPVVSTDLLGLRSVFSDSVPVTWVDTPGQVLQACLDLQNSLPSNRDDVRGSFLTPFEPSVSLRSLEQALRSVMRSNGKK